MKKKNECRDLIEYLKNTVLSYCRCLPYAEYILEEEFLSELPFIYYSYPCLYVYAFKPELNEDDIAFLQTLSISGFLIYRSTLIKDRLIDNQDSKKVGRIGYANYLGAKETCAETAVKLLSNLFSEDSDFCFFWKQRKNEYLKAIELDCSLH